MRRNPEYTNDLVRASVLTAVGLSIGMFRIDRLTPNEYHAIAMHINNHKALFNLIDWSMSGYGHVYKIPGIRVRP